jgi:hypothetical protein
MVLIEPKEAQKAQSLEHHHDPYPLNAGSIPHIAQDS